MSAFSIDISSCYRCLDWMIIQELFAESLDKWVSQRVF